MTRGEIGVDEPCKDSSLTAELAGVTLRAAHVFLDRNWDIKTEIPGKVYRAHPALRDDAFNSISIVN